jgi:hypothetical protein
VTGYNYLKFGELPIAVGQGDEPMKHVLIAGGMFLGALVIIVAITQVLDVVLSQKAPATVDSSPPASKPDGSIARPSQPGTRSPLPRSADSG